MIPFILFRSSSFSSRSEPPTCRFCGKAYPLRENEDWKLYTKLIVGIVLGMFFLFTFFFWAINLSEFQDGFENDPGSYVHYLKEFFVGIWHTMKHVFN